mmetsp:Transcript_19465/g.54704  ORF Transcript_19465/g.54704 Transcript_19465/m.54704 type:complete len:370 (+) Transcript_19465:522-1631(+)
MELIFPRAGAEFLHLLAVAVADDAGSQHGGCWPRPPAHLGERQPRLPGDDGRDAGLAVVVLRVPLAVPHAGPRPLPDRLRRIDGQRASAGLDHFTFGDPLAFAHHVLGRVLLLPRVLFGQGEPLPAVFGDDERSPEGVELGVLLLDRSPSVSQHPRHVLRNGRACRDPRRIDAGDVEKPGDLSQGPDDPVPGGVLGPGSGERVDDFAGIEVRHQVPALGKDVSEDVPALLARHVLGDVVLPVSALGHHVPRRGAEDQVPPQSGLHQHALAVLRMGSREQGVRALDPFVLVKEDVFPHAGKDLERGVPNHGSDLVGGTPSSVDDKVCTHSLGLSHAPELGAFARAVHPLLRGCPPAPAQRPDRRERIRHA